MTPSSPMHQPTWLLNMQRLMRAQNLTPRRLSLCAGLNATAVRDLLSGRAKNPRLDTMLALAKVLGVTLATLIGETATTASAPQVPEKLELLTDILTQLLEAAADMPIAPEPDDLAAIATTLYRQLLQSASPVPTTAIADHVAMLTGFLQQRRKTGLS